MHFNFIKAALKRWVAFFLVGFGLAACLPTIDVPERVAFVDGAISLSLCRAGLNWSSSSPRQCALMISKDRGKTWVTHRIDGLRDFVFDDAGRGVLLIGSELHRTEDGGAAKTLVKDFEDPAAELRATDFGLLLLTQKAVHLTTDPNRLEWERIDFPPMGDMVRPVSAAAGPGSLAVASSVGRVYIRSDGQWREWIVGGIHDLTYWKGSYYAATQMATIATLDGQSVRHTELEPSYTPTSFLPFEGTLYVWGAERLHKVVGHEVIPIDGLEIAKENRLRYARAALLSPRELLAFSTTEKGPEIRILSLSSGRIEKIELPEW